VGRIGEKSSNLDTTAAWLPEAEVPPALLDTLKGQLLDYASPLCVIGRQGEPIYSNAAYQVIAEYVTEADRAPQRQDGEEVALVIGERIERFTLRTRSIGGPDGSTALTATILEPRHDHEWANTALDNALERLEDITRLVTDWIWETNRNLVLTFVSPRVNDTTGYHQYELTGRTLLDLPTETNQTLQALQTAENRKPFRDLEIRIAARDGHLRDVLLSGLPVFCRKSGEFLGYRGTAHDITEIRARESAIHKAREDAELASRAKSEFLANMSHELRTPLNAIIGFSEIMGGEMLGPLGSTQYKGYVHDISESARHLLALITDILDASKIESGHMPLSETEVNPGALIGSVIRLMTPRAGRAGLSLYSDTDPSLPNVLADETKLKQILINLAANAVKFTRPGGRIDLSAKIGESGELVIFVSDTGIGIAPHDIDRALTPFGQVESQLNRSFEGTGLGLPLAKSMTEMHGGTFDLVSQLDVGTTVTIRLPESRVLRA